MESSCFPYSPPLSRIIKARFICRLTKKNEVPDKSSPLTNMKGKYQHFVNIGCHRNSAPSRQLLGMEKLLPSSEKLGPKKEQVLSDSSNLSTLLLFYAHNGFFSETDAVWDKILDSPVGFNALVVSELIGIYGCSGDFDRISRVLQQMHLKEGKLLSNIFTLSINYFGRTGQLQCMEFMIKEMDFMGCSVDPAIGNAYILYYSSFGSLSEMETTYDCVKKSRIVVEEEAIRAISLAYIKRNKLYSLGKFMYDLGLGRRDVGNLIWNLLLLSYAGNFKMKSLQREFVNMVEAGFRPDLDTFNIRAIAFSKMSLLWDLHLSLEHMKHDSVTPDLITYGCIVDLYIDKRLPRNIDFSLSKLNWYDRVSISTDPLVFEVMGLGDFHSDTEVLLENSRNKDWTYKMLIDRYLKKKFRGNQVFWNY